MEATRLLGALLLKLLEAYVDILITWDRTMPLGEKERPLVGKVGECDVASRHLQGYSPRLCRLRTDGLAPASKYWTCWSHAGDMCPVSLVAYRQQVLGFSALLQWLCWERNWGGSHGPLSRVEWWSREHFFSGAMHPSNPVDNLMKGCYM
jgi:hypothetical protein